MIVAEPTTDYIFAALVVYAQAVLEFHNIEDEERVCKARGKLTQKRWEEFQTRRRVAAGRRHDALDVLNKEIIRFRELFPFKVPGFRHTNLG